MNFYPSNRNIPIKTSLGWLRSKVPGILISLGWLRSKVPGILISLGWLRSKVPGIPIYLFTKLRTAISWRAKNKTQPFQPIYEFVYIPSGNCSTLYMKTKIYRFLQGLFLGCEEPYRLPTGLRDDWKEHIQSFFLPFWDSFNYCKLIFFYFLFLQNLYHTRRQNYTLKDYRI